MVKLNRRGFLKSSLIATGVAIAAPMMPSAPATGLIHKVEFGALAKEFHVSTVYVRDKTAWFTHVWGKFQDGLEYECAEYHDEELTTEVKKTCMHAMLRRYQFINDETTSLEATWSDVGS